MLAHGVGRLVGFSLPVWLFAYLAASSVAIWFVALRVLWPTPRLAAAARGRPAPGWVAGAARAVGGAGRVLTFVLFGTTMVAAWFGVDSVGENLAPTALYVVLWVGLPVVSALFGDVWRRWNPLHTLAAGVDRLAGRPPDTDRSSGVWATHWPAAASVAGFLWLELAYHQPGSVPAIAVFLAAYSTYVLIGAGVFGAGWTRVGDGFAVVFSLVGAVAPVHRDELGRLRWRWPGAGLAEVHPREGTLGVVAVVLGAATFDGFTHTRLWIDRAGGRGGWELTVVNTVGLLLVIGTVAVAFLVASRLAAVVAGEEGVTLDEAWRWVPSLVPIMLAYSVAHYFQLLVFQGQAFVAQLSDPLGQGWNLFGTADHVVSYTAMTPNQIASVQVAAIVAGHAAAVTVARDRAVELFPQDVAVRTQLPVVALMALSAAGGLVLLLGT